MKISLAALIIMISGNLWAGGAVNLSTDAIIGYSAGQGGGSPDHYLVSLMLDRFEGNGVFLSSGALEIIGSASGGIKRCSLKKHSWNVKYKFSVFDVDNVDLIYESLSKPIRIGMYIDGGVSADGNVSLRPSIKVFGSCVKLDRVNVGVGVPVIPVDVLVSVEINLNPRVIRPENSDSGRFEVSVSPSGVARASIQTFGAVDPNVDVSYSDGTGASIIAATYVNPVAGLFVALGLGGAFDSYLEDKLEDEIVSSIEEIKKKGFSYDISDNLGGEVSFVIPDSSDFSRSEIGYLFSQAGIFPVGDYIHSQGYFSEYLANLYHSSYENEFVREAFSKSASHIMTSGFFLNN